MNFQSSVNGLRRANVYVSLNTEQTNAVKMTEMLIEEVAVVLKGKPALRLLSMTLAGVEWMEESLQHSSITIDSRK